MKDKKKLFIIGGLILLVIIGVCFIFFKYDNKPSNESGNSSDLTAPAANTEELLQEMNTVEITNITEDEIVFSNNVGLKENEKVAVWIYSEPKFLGYFEVLVENGIKKIIGLKEALKNISIEVGKHNIAITTESGNPIGYIDVEIKDNGQLSESAKQEENQEQITEQPTENDESNDSTGATIEKEEPKAPVQSNPQKEEPKTTTKEIVETIEINYGTTKQNEVNMLRGTTSVDRAGQKGQKVITYTVTYDSNGTEISRQVKNEKVTKEPVNEIVKIGTSDFNMNRDMLTEISFGPMCTELLTDEFGYKSCAEGTLEYVAIKINTTYYITSIKENGIAKFNGLIKTIGSEGINLIANYNGIKYYFYMSAGGGQYELLTEETCSKYGLSCGRW